MPVPSFISAFADKAQSAINASPLAAHLPSSTHHRPTSPDPANQPTANEAAAQGGSKSHTLEALQHQFRSLQQQYGTTTPVQKIITIQKGVAIDLDSLSRDSKAHSKELYTWGQSEAEDLKDVTDRLAYLNFVQGSLATSLATKLDGARVPFKALRDAEIAIQPRRNIRASLQNQISRIEHDQQKGYEKKLGDLRDQLRKAELDDQHQERDIEILKRKAVRESEQLKWDAIREYGEKLVLLSQAATPIIAVLPPIPPTPNSPYAGGQTTGAVRASLQRALDNYKTGHINLPPHLAGADLSRSDTRSFGESHASELSSIHSEVSSHANSQTPVSASMPLPTSAPIGGGPNQPLPSSQSPPINPSTLNQSPAPIPLSAPSPPMPQEPSLPTAVAPVPMPVITPTVAETGVPVSAGPDGPGPASGSLHDIKASSPSASLQVYGQVPQRNESAAEEKRRLAEFYSQQVSAPGPSDDPSRLAGPPPEFPRHETAEEEKKRLEREERERILHADNDNSQSRKNTKDNEDLPPYQEPGLQ
ncbi:Eisosome component PIL1-domain-containing protein [Panaeolus papilionaceus]|nr:Eisosome component PIL1-domain-containing protein [Panaeolus papilionaceus]